MCNSLTRLFPPVSNLILFVFPCWIGGKQKEQTVQLCCFKTTKLVPKLMEMNRNHIFNVRKCGAGTWTTAASLNKRGGSWQTDCFTLCTLWVKRFNETQAWQEGMKTEPVFWCVVTLRPNIHSSLNSVKLIKVLNLLNQKHFPINRGRSVDSTRSLPVGAEKVSPQEFLGFGGRGRRGKRFVGVELKMVEGGVGDGL